VATSNSNDLFAREVQPYHARQFGFVEAAPDSIADVRVKRREIVRFGKDRLAESASRIASLGCLPSTTKMISFIGSDLSPPHANRHTSLAFRICHNR
jgi:hypothetical protein